MEAQLKGAVLLALVVLPQWRSPILSLLQQNYPLNPPKSETAPHPGWQDGTILGPGKASMVALNQPRIIPYCDYRDFGVCPVLLDCLECLDFVP